jgi:hypothetical protein
MIGLHFFNSDKDCHSLSNPNFAFKDAQLDGPGKPEGAFGYETYKEGPFCAAPSEKCTIPESATNKTILRSCKL